MAFTIEWHEITLHTYAEKLFMLKELEPVFVKAFVPVEAQHIHTYDQRLVTAPADKIRLIEQEVLSELVASQRLWWNTKIHQLYTDVHDKHVSAAYIAIAKDEEQKNIGLILFEKRGIKDFLALRLQNIIEGPSSEQVIVTSSECNDEICIEVLAVMPGAQKKGLGRALVFSVYDHCPFIKKIYLTTSNLNTRAQAFYEHLDFIRFLKGTFVVGAGAQNFNREKIVYVYQKTVIE
ncbi:MAG: hypothetical protein UU47_C0021G0003 [candidate division TM6 bacterium GW2011_GWE2_41_16]|nr:MAG: hypothetical protein UU47_C0021G0003 [candidate division TM6 bacterium GW2011_GWE2_41_16]